MSEAVALEWEEAFGGMPAEASLWPLGYHWGLRVAIIELGGMLIGVAIN